MTGKEQGLKDRMTLRIAQLRWSLVELAETTGESYRNVHRWLREDVKVPAHFISRFVEVVPVDSNWLLTGSGSPDSVSDTEAQEVLDRVVAALGSVRTNLAGEDLTHLALAVAGEGIAIVDANGVVREWNPAMERLTRIPASQAVGGAVTSVLKPALVSESDSLAHLLTSGERGEIPEIELRSELGAHPYPAKLSWVPGRNALGNPAGGVLVLRPHGDVQHVQSLLQETEERYRRLVELNSDPVLVQSEGRVVLANDALRRLLDWGEDPSELTGTLIQDLIPAHEWEWRSQALREVEEGKGLGVLPRTLLRRDGSTVSVEITAVGVRLNGQAGSQAVVKRTSTS
ncbi:MAG: PAS domain-containing protein [Gemmatimonadota bacterium]